LSNGIQSESKENILRGEKRLHSQKGRRDDLDVKRSSFRGSNLCHHLFAVMIDWRGRRGKRVITRREGGGGGEVTCV
jgi:hypothetical protein